MRIDFRIRPPYKSFKNTQLFNPREENPDPVTLHGLMANMPYCRSFEEYSMEAFLEEMDEARIDMAVITGRINPGEDRAVSNDDIAELVEKWPDRFIGFGGVDLDSPDRVKQVEDLAARGFRGIGIECGWTSPPRYDDDEDLMPMYARCEELGLIVTITSSIFVGTDLSYSDPIHIQRVAKRFPNLKIVISHGSWPWVMNACGVAFQCRNVYLMPDMYLNVPGIPGASEFVTAANNYLSYRTLHGSSYPIRPLQDSIDGLLAAGLASDEITERVLGLNAQRLLGLEGQPSRFDQG